MDLREFDELVGGSSYVRCEGKIRKGKDILNVDQAEAHLKSGGQIGWWVRTGYIVVDIDEGQKEAIQAIRALGIDTLIGRTTKGLHVYFKTDKNVRQQVGMILPIGLKTDVRCALKGYVMLPYNMEGRSFGKVRDVINMPVELTPMNERKDSLYGLKEGDGRNAVMFAHMMAYKNRGANDQQIEIMAEIVNNIIFGQPMEEEELAKIVDNTKKYDAKLVDNPYIIYNAKGNPSQINALAVREHFVDRGDIFVLGGEAYQYKDGYFGIASQEIRHEIGNMIGVANLLTQTRIGDVYRFIVDDPRLKKMASELNANKKLINFKNGVWDIDRKELLPHSATYFQTIQIPWEIRKPKIAWEDTLIYKFFTKECGLPEEDIDMICKYMAYSLTLDYGLKTFMVLQGQSNTGKSVLIRFFETLVGKSNTSSLSMHELNMRFYPAQLHNRLLNSCADNSSLALESIDNLKKITGGDQIMHEGKGKDPFFFVPFSKLLFSFNQMPLQLEEKSNAFYLRMRILYMNNALSINNDYVNTLCSDESIEETLAHLIQRLPVKEIPRTKKSSRLIEALRQDSDSIHAFITKSCTEGEDKFTTKRSLYDAYARFCLDNGREAHKKHGFYRHLRSLGYKEVRHPDKGDACWKGIGLKK